MMHESWQLEAARQSGGNAIGMLVASKGNIQPMSMDEYKDSISENWFVSTCAFLQHACHTPVNFPDHFPDGLDARAILVLSKFGVLKSLHTCPKCAGSVRLQKTTDTQEWEWLCESAGHKHGHHRVSGQGHLRTIRVQNWMAFLHFVTMMRLQEKWSKIRLEMMVLYGVKKQETLDSWRATLQGSLRRWLLDHDDAQIGGPGVVVVIDETSFGHIGVSKAPGGVNHGMDRRNRLSKARQSHIKQRLPARTIHKKPAKNPLGKSRKAKTDLRSDSRWVWAAVTVGKGREVHTHANGKKRFSFEILPKPKDAPAGKPRGLQSIRTTIQKHVAAGSFLVFDKWRATVYATKSLGYDHAPPVNHSSGFRERTQGFHSNDIESEFNRLKRFVRGRYGVLSKVTEDNVWGLKAGEIYEYQFYNNVGNSMGKVMAALQYSA